MFTVQVYRGHTAYGKRHTIVSSRSELELEIQAIDPRFSIVESANRPGLSNIFFEGVNYDLPVISTTNIKDEIDHAHRYIFPNGMSTRLWSKPEIIGRLQDFIKNLDKVKEDYA